MKKQWAKMSIVLALALSLMGCGNTIPEMTEEQSAMISEYAAGLLLSNMKSGQSKLVDDETLAILEAEAAEKAKLEQEKAAAAAAKKEKETASDKDGEKEQNAPLAVIDIADFLGLKGMTIKYLGFEVTDSYTEGEDELALAMDAIAGHKLVVVKFQLTNNEPEDCQCDVLSKNVYFKLDYGNGYKSTLMTMLHSDLSLLDRTIPAGQSTEVVLLLQVKEEEANNITKLSMRMSYNGQSAETALNQ